jgi:hypothetical protein
MNNIEHTYNSTIPRRLGSLKDFLPGLRWNLISNNKTQEPWSTVKYLYITNMCYGMVSGASTISLKPQVDTRTVYTTEVRPY